MLYKTERVDKNYKWCFVRQRDICYDGIRILRGGNIGELTIQLQQDDVFLPHKYFDEEKQIKMVILLLLLLPVVKSQ